MFHYESSDNDDESRNSVPSEASSSITITPTVIIDDGIEDEEFERCVADLVTSIQMEMHTYGDDGDNGDANVNDLKTVEYRIQSKRILQLIDACVENVRFGLMLPSMLKDTTNPRAMEMAKLLSSADRECLIEMPAVLASKGLTEKELDGLNEQYNYIQLCIRASEQCGLKQLVPEYVNQLSDEATRFLDTLNEFRQMAHLRISWTAPKAMAKEKRLYAMWSENKNNRQLVVELQKKVGEAQRQMHDRTEKSEHVLEEFKRRLELINQDNDERIEQAIYESNLKMNKTCVESEQKQQELLKLANKTKAEYETMLRENLVSGKKMRENKLKMQQKLQSWLLKYDSEVGGRSRELFTLRDQLDEERDAFKKEMDKFEIQEVEFLDIEAKILAEWTRERDEKLRLFTLNYAARIVQRAFRKFLKKRKAMRKKAKKGKKGKT